jgi:hypothetical protein
MTMEYKPVAKPAKRKSGFLETLFLYYDGSKWDVFPHLPVLQKNKYHRKSEETFEQFNHRVQGTCDALNRGEKLLMSGRNNPNHPEDGRRQPMQMNTLELILHQLQMLDQRMQESKQPIMLKLLTTEGVTHVINIQQVIEVEFCTRGSIVPEKVCFVYLPTKSLIYSEADPGYTLLADIFGLSQETAK